MGYEMTVTKTTPKDPGFKFTIAAKDLLDLSTCETFAAKDQARPILTGVLFEVDGLEVTATATDSYRLVFMKRAIQEVLGGAVTFLVPGSDLVRIAKEFSKMAGKSAFSFTFIDVVVGERFALFSYRGTSHQVELSEGQYPDVKKLVPKIDGIKAMEGIAFAPDFMADFSKVAPFNVKRPKGGPMPVGSIVNVLCMNDARRPAVFGTLDHSTLLLLMPVAVK